jgi:hypothetical protein
VPPAGVAVLAALLAVSALASSARYVPFWRDHNASEQYVKNLQGELRAAGKVDLADQVVPEEVLAPIMQPDNTTKLLAPLLSDDVSFPTTSDDLAAVSPDGRLRHAEIEARAEAEPGPVPGCGYRVGGHGTTIPLDGRLTPWVWWLRIGYLASGPSPVTVVTGQRVTQAEVQGGANTLFVRVDDAGFDDVRLEGLDPGVVVCVDAVEAGDVVAGEDFE